MKKNKRSVKSTKARADKIFSELIRRSNSDDGYCTCCTCGIRYRWTEIDCGHYKSRRHNNTRFNRKNVAPQCKICNRFEEGRLYEFGKYLVDKYGEGIIDELNSLSRINRRFTVEELDLMIDWWKKELENL